MLLFILGLFERDKLLFSFQMTIKIMEADGNVKQDELDFFLKGNIALEKSSRQKPFPWLPYQGWEDIIRLCSVTPEVFGSLADDIERNETAWREVKSHLLFARISFLFMLFFLCSRSLFFLFLLFFILLFLFFLFFFFILLLMLLLLSLFMLFLLLSMLLLSFFFTVSLLFFFNYLAKNKSNFILLLKNAIRTSLLFK